MATWSWHIMTCNICNILQHIATCYNCLVKRYATSGMTATSSVGVESLGNIYWKTMENFIGHPDDFPWTHRKNQHNYVFHCFPLNPAAGYGLLNPKFLLIKSPWSWIIIPPRNPPRHFFGGQNEQKNGWLKTMKGTNPYFNGSFLYKSSSYWGTPIVGNLHINIHYSLITSFSVRALWLLASTRRRRETCKARRALRQRRLPQGLGQVFFFDFRGFVEPDFSGKDIWIWWDSNHPFVTTLRYFELDKMDDFGAWTRWSADVEIPGAQKFDLGCTNNPAKKMTPMSVIDKWTSTAIPSEASPCQGQIGAIGEEVPSTWMVARWKMIRSIHGRYPME